MKAIWKFPLETTGRQTIAIPKDGFILHVAAQFNIPCLWVEVDPTAPKVDRQFEIFGTGHPIPEADRDYLGSYFLDGGSLVFHVIELP
jgi:hypothetical protein